MTDRDYPGSAVSTSISISPGMSVRVCIIYIYILYTYTHNIQYTIYVYYICNIHLLIMGLDGFPSLSRHDALLAKSLGSRIDSQDSGA